MAHVEQMNAVRWALTCKLEYGGGYQTQFVLFTDNGATGTVYFFDHNGNPIGLPLQ
jgi:hypothetical protein